MRARRSNGDGPIDRVKKEAEIKPASLAELNVEDLKKATDLLIRVRARILAAVQRGATGNAWFDQEERVVQAWMMLDAVRKAFEDESR